MKKRFYVFAFMAILVMMPFVTWAQSAQIQPENKGMKLESISVSSGEDAISSGLSETTRFSSDKGVVLEGTLQQEQWWLIAGKKYEKGRFSAFVSVSAGQFQGAPWVGPLVTADVKLGTIAGQEFSFSGMEWPAFFFKTKPKDWRENWALHPEAIPVGQLMSVRFNIGNLSLVYSGLDFLNDKYNHLPGVGWTQKINESFSTTTSVTRNFAKKHWMYFLGITWKKGK